MIRRTIALLIFLLSGTVLWAQTELTEPRSTPLCIGESVIFYSESLQEERLLNIYLPLGYHPDSAKTYSVIYLLDGSMDEDMLHISGLVQFASFPWIELIPETIVVGIANVDRKRDFTFPSSSKIDQEELPTSGGAEHFIRFLEDEVKPLIQSEYNVNGQETLIGQSLGGLLAAEILLHGPGMYENYIIVSPSLWWDDESLLNASLVMPPPGIGIFIAVGKEGEVMEEEARALYDKLSNRFEGWRHISFKYLENQSHGDALHLAVYHAFEALFPRSE